MTFLLREKTEDTWHNIANNDSYLQISRSNMKDTTGSITGVWVWVVVNAKYHRTNASLLSFRMFYLNK